MDGVDPENLQIPEPEKPLSYDDLTRRDVRSLIMHILYAAESFEYQESLESIVDNFNKGFDLDIPLDSEVVSTARAIIQLKEELDDLYKPLLTNWRFDRIGVCTKLILRFALWELKYTDTDPSIIINEAVELAKCFAEHDAFRFINGILDRVVNEVNIRENNNG
jgi:N utilization substance protein B